MYPLPTHPSFGTLTFQICLILGQYSWMLCTLLSQFWTLQSVQRPSLNGFEVPGKYTQVTFLTHQWGKTLTQANALLQQHSSFITQKYVMQVRMC